jgi:hypothetical protein
MHDRQDLFLSLLTGLDGHDQRFVLDQIASARKEQIERRRHPPRRRRRNAHGELVWPDPVSELQ